LENGGVGAAIASGYKWLSGPSDRLHRRQAGDGQMDPAELESIGRPCD